MHALRMRLPRSRAPYEKKDTVCLPASTNLLHGSPSRLRMELSLIGEDSDTTRESAKAVVALDGRRRRATNNVQGASTNHEADNGRQNDHPRTNCRNDDSSIHLTMETSGDARKNTDSMRDLMAMPDVIIP
ncbi:hypothetical protein CLAIMM_06525, partial [Cladophialophora immunda]